MKKTFLTVGIVSTLAFFLLTLVMPAKLGQFVYDNATDLEAKLYGLEEAKVDIGDMSISLYQNKFSNRPTILMLHGYSADKDVWPRFAKYFLDDFNVLIPDMAGHGDTGYKPDWDYSGPAQAKRLVQLLDELELEKVHVIGNSMGGFIAAHFARSFPDRTLTATFIDPVGVKSPKLSDMEKLLVQGRNPFEINNRQEFDEFFSMTMASPPWFPDFILEAVSEKYQTRREQLVKIFEGYHLQDMLDDSLGEINVPTLLLWGAKDQLIHESSVDIWRKGIKNLKVKVWPEIGHMPMMEIPNESAQEYFQFLN